MSNETLHGTTSFEQLSLLRSWLGLPALRSRLLIRQTTELLHGHRADRGTFAEKSNGFF